MYRGDRIPWDEGDFPYEVLGAAGVTPGTPASELDAALFYFMEEESEDLLRAQQAINQLLKLEERLSVDFFLYFTGPEDGSA